MIGGKPEEVALGKEDPEDDMEKKEEEETEQWSSRMSFILACIGSAIGLGNFWRFPQLAFKYGGGAFFVPYILATLLLGIPLVQLEMALGQVMQKAATQSFGKLDPRWRGIGVGAALIAFTIVSFYMAILGWSNVMFVESFYKDMPWSIYGLSGEDVITVPSDYFYNDLLQLRSNFDHTKLISSAPFAGSFFMWACVFGILIKGQAFISKAVWVTVLLPVFTMLILVVVGATLPGASIGINAYLGIGGDLSALSSGEVWYDAAMQVFFSLSLSTGVLQAFASMNPSHQNVLQDAVIVAVSNGLFSFLSGFAVFAIVGYMSEQSGLSIAELNAQGLLGGPSLAFVAYPAGLSLVGGAGANVLCVLFFITFFLLGVDSAFSLVESAVYNLRETSLLGGFSRDQAVTLVCGAGFLWTVLYCSDLGLYLLDVVDRYGSTFALNLIGFAECFVCGWLYNKEATVTKVGKNAALLFDVGFWAGFSLFTALALGLPYSDLPQSSTLAIAFGVGVPVAFGSAAAAVFLGSRPGTNNSASTALRALTLDGPQSLAELLNDTITDGAPSNWRFRPIWSLLLKFIMSPVLFFLLAMQVEELSSSHGFGGYPAWMNALGAIVFIAIAAVVAIGFVHPALYEEVHPKVSSSNTASSAKSSS